MASQAPSPSQEVVFPFSRYSKPRSFRTNRYNEILKASSMDILRSPQEWLNINSFISLLVAEDLVPRFAQLWLWVLRNTLDIGRDVETLEKNVLSVAA